jgi:hypothetical protein
MDLPDRGLSKHHEGETGPGGEDASPTIVAAVETGRDLVDIVCSTHAPFHVVVLEKVITVLEVLGIAVGLDRFGARGGMDVGVVSDVHVVVALTGLEAQVVEAGVSILAVVAYRGDTQESLVRLKWRMLLTMLLRTEEMVCIFNNYIISQSNGE